MRYRKWLVPEVVQTSTIDCGPACLNALLGGFGVYVSYGRLREACQTSVDGTSIDTIEELSNRLGLTAEQVVLPPDHLALPAAAALPSIVVVKLPSGFTHFAVIWRRHWGMLQVMDPASGRQWIPIREFAKRLYSHEMIVPAEDWKEWAQSPEFIGSLAARLRAINHDRAESSRLIREALAQPGWRGIAALDAAARMAGSLARTGALRTKSAASRLLPITFRRAMEDPENADQSIPRPYWSAWPAETGDELVVRGAVAIRVKGRNPTAANVCSLPPEIVSAVKEMPPRPGWELLRLLKRDGMLTPALTAVALFISTVGVMLQALLFRALMEGGREFSARGARLSAIVAVLLLMAALVPLEIPAVASLIAMGRRLETRFRTALLTKLPRIAEEYFHSRLISDMAERTHNVHYLRMLPNLAGQFLRSAFELMLTAAGIVWIDHHLWPLAALSVVMAIALPAAIQPALSERTLRVRTHAGALSRFYLDSLLGLIPIRTHVADSTVRTEHASLLGKWASSAFAAQRAGIGMEGLQMAVGFALAALLTISHLSRYPESAAVLLLAYWSLNLPMIGRDLVTLGCEYPIYRNILLRLMEPLSALERAVPKCTVPAAAHPCDGAAAISIKNVAVVAGGHAVLHDISLDIPAGSHVAIVGASGAGKSTLAALLLGLRMPTSGTLTVDGRPLTQSVLDELHRASAWVDPSVHLWNASLLENLRYGLEGQSQVPLGNAVDRAELSAILDKLPEGLQTSIGDNGALLSAGEGQRVRLARALLRPGVRLAVLDEPFRGLDADMRQSLLETVRSQWRDATLFLVTHDIAQTLSFDRVLVLDAGAIAEDGSPAQLAKAPDSLYSALLREETELRSQLLSASDWRRLRMLRGTLSEECETLQLASESSSSEALAS
ncbi:MAG: ATP-binding cassette domain-containing protein [Acidobacteriia bacterium]|nr:ATP-binding cassette domain-containing protein [Terriglobia bacterium]